MNAYKVNMIRIESTTNSVVLSTTDNSDLFGLELELVISPSDFNRLLGVWSMEGFDLDDSTIFYSSFERNSVEIGVYDLRNYSKSNLVYPEMFNQTARLLRA